MAWSVHILTRRAAFRGGNLEGPHIHSGDAVTAGHRVGTPPWDFGSSGIHSQVYQLVFVKHVQLARHRGWPSQGKRQLLPSRHMPVKE